MLALQITRGHVQADRVTEDVVVDLLLRDVPALLSHNHSQLDFIVQLLGCSVMDHFS